MCCLRMGHVVLSVCGLVVCMVWPCEFVGLPFGCLLFASCGGSVALSLRSIVDCM